MKATGLRNGWRNGWRTMLLMGAIGLLPSGGFGSPPATGSAEARFGLNYAPVEFTPPEGERAALANGIALHHYQEAEVPLVTVLVRVAAGSIDDPPGKQGATEMTGEVIRNGGSEKLPGDALDRELESRGALLSVQTTREETWFRLSVLKEDLDWGLGLLSDLLAHPRMPADKLEEARGRKLVDLQQRLDVPRDAARALFPQLVFGRGNPWGWTSTSRTLGSIKIEDLQALRQRCYRADRLMLGMAGAVAFDPARSLAEQYFGPEAFAGEPARPLTPPPVEPVAQTRVYVVPQPLTQNVVYFGHEGISRFADEKFAVRLFNEILSGGFSSRLIKEVRSDRGLAYLVYGQIGEGTVRGIFYNVALTKVQTTTQTLRVMLDVDESLREAPPRPEEVELARQATVNSFVFLFDTAEQIVRQQMTLDAFHYPKDYLATYVQNLKAVTADAIQQAARKDLRLDQLVILIYGAVDARLRAELEKLGPITEISDEQLRKEWL